jgi:hypothetical protein
MSTSWVGSMCLRLRLLIIVTIKLDQLRARHRLIAEADIRKPIPATVQ